MKHTILIKIFLIAILFSSYQSHLFAVDDSPPVKQLKALISTNNDFKTTVDKMLENIHQLSDGSDNPWKGKNIHDLYTFLNEWFYFLPNKHNGLDRIIEFTFLYYKNPYGKQFILEEPGLTWSLYFIEERGKYMDSPASTRIIDEWLTDNTLNHEDFILPANGFSSFNEFFTRDLKPGARPVDSMEDNAIITSPADGIINMINNDLKLDSEIPTKGNMTLSLSKLLDSSSYSEKFVGGTALAVFLMPDNYHHYHAPVSGIIVESKEDVGNRLFGLPDIKDMINNGNLGYNKNFSVFQDFRHGYFIFKTRNHGYIAMVPIGLQTVGSVVFEDKFKNLGQHSSKTVSKGEKLGHFAYGGSTVLLLFEKNTLNAISVQQGQSIGKLGH